MASAWGKSFGLAFGAAWGLLSAEPQQPGVSMGSPNYAYRKPVRKDPKRVRQKRQNEQILALLLM